MSTIKFRYRKECIITFDKASFFVRLTAEYLNDLTYHIDVFAFLFKDVDIPWFDTFYTKDVIHAGKYKSCAHNRSDNSAGDQTAVYRHTNIGSRTHQMSDESEPLD